MPTILEIGLTTAAGHRRIGELVLADPDEATDRGAVGSMPGRFPAMVFQYDDEWLRHGFSLGADLPLIEGVQRPVVDPLEADPVLRARGAAFGFVCDHAPGLWVERLFAAAGSTQINALKGDESASLCTAGQLWAAAGHAGHRFGALDLPLTHGNQREFSPLVLDLAKPREAAKTVRELTLAFEFLASGRGLRSTKDLELLLTAATDVGGRSPKTLVALGKKREAAVPGVGTSSQERILRFAPAGDALNPAMVTAVARELAARCGLSVVAGGLMGSAGYLEARFDRTPEGAPVFVQSAATLVRRKRRSRAQPMAAAAGYLDAADILNREGADAAGDLKELFGRLLFNALIGNNRDRLDQIWLTPTSSGVKLLPMYGPTATPSPATGGRQLSTPIRGTGTIVTPEAVVANARYFGLSSARAKMLCLEFTQIVSGWREVAQAVGADFFTVSQMARLFEQ